MSRRLQIEALAAVVLVGMLLLFQARTAQVRLATPAQPALIAREEPRAISFAFPVMQPRPPASHEVQDAVAEARLAHIDPVELGQRLRTSRDGRAMLDALVDERDPAIALKLAQALGGMLDDGALRAQAIDALRTARSREVSLLALLGRGEPDAVQLEADTLASGSSEERATAAFLLNNAPSAPPRSAIDAARAALQDPQAGARLREESATLLGKAGDVDALREALFGKEAEPAVRMRALAALDMAGDDIGADCDRLAADPNTPPRLAEMAKAWRAAHP